MCHFLDDPFLAEWHTRCAQNAVSLRHPGSSPGEGTNIFAGVAKKVDAAQKRCQSGQLKKLRK